MKKGKISSVLYYFYLRFLYESLNCSAQIFSLCDKVRHIAMTAAETVERTSMFYDVKGVIG
jgi:hypothetical protein